MRQPRGSLIWFLFSFRGRISRIEFWVFHLALTVLGFVGLLALGLALDPLFFRTSAVTVATEILISYALIGLMALAVLCSLAVTAKRFHDRGRPGWWSLMVVVPVIGALWILIECGCLRGSSGENRYGPDPLGGHSEGLSDVFE